MLMNHRHLRTLLVAAACGCITIFAACSASTVSNSTPTPTATPTTGTSAQAGDILTHAKNAHLQDASFTITVTAGSGSSTAATANGTGKLTSSPARTDIKVDKVSLTGIGSVGPVEVITDESQGVFVKFPPINTWQNVPASVLNTSIGTVDFLHYDQLQNVTVVATEQINGAAAWHLRGTLQTTVSGVSASANWIEDLWIRQDNYFPAQVEVRNAAGVATPTTQTPTNNREIDEKLTFTQWNSGVTINLPAVGSS